MIYDLVSQPVGATSFSFLALLEEKISALVAFLLPDWKNSELTVFSRKTGKRVLITSCLTRKTLTS